MVLFHVGYRGKHAVPILSVGVEIAWITFWCSSSSDPKAITL